jgi:hypothetical protein
LSDKFLTVLQQITGMKSDISGTSDCLFTEHPGKSTVIKVDDFLAAKRDLMPVR